MVSQNSSNNTVQDNDFSVNRATASTTSVSSSDHSDNTSATSHASLRAQVGGTSGGDPFVYLNVPSGEDYSIGVDNTDSDRLKITDGADPSTGNDLVTVDPSTQNTWVNGLSFNGGTDVLSSFESGTFTPDLEFGGASVGLTYLARNGIYVRVGDIVFVSLSISLSNKGSSTGLATVTNLPVTPIMFPSRLSVLGPQILTLGAGNLPLAVSQTNSFLLSETEVFGSVNALDDTAFANTTIITVDGFYHV